MNFRIDWIDGRPAEAVRGMLIQFEPCYGKGLFLVGDDSTLTDEDLDYVVRYGYLAQPHELDWIADMAQRHGKGRPQE